MTSSLVLAAGISLLALAGCASSSVLPGYESPVAASDSRPKVVLVYPFDVPPDVVTENQSPIVKGIKALRSDTPEARQAELSREVQERMAQDLVDGINRLGLPSQLGDPSVAPPHGAVVVGGQFTSVNEGNRLRRNIIGFGAGKSTVDVYVTMAQVGASGTTTLMVFATHADSGAMPGAIVTGGAGAAAGAGAGVVVGTNVGLAAIKSYRSQVEELASKSADQVIAHLSQYFAQHGWISQDKAKIAQRSD